jgi:flagellar basal-body rod modification protein FlgD
MAVVSNVDLSMPKSANASASISPSSSPVPQASKSDPQAIQSDFLKLLVAQMQNQNPMEPMDNLEFTSQLAQFSALEQATNTNKILEQMQATFGSRSSIDPVSLIGKEVAVGQNTIEVLNGQPTSVSISLAKDAASLDAALIDQSGKEVARYPQGEHKAGHDAIQIVPVGPDGNPLADGTYTVRFDAKDTSGKPLSVDTGMKGVVQSVTLDGKAPMLIVDSKEVPLSSISRVSLTY